MKDVVFRRVLLTLTALCCLLTAAHLAYAVYAYAHCSIIAFIAGEIW